MTRLHFLDIPLCLVAVASTLYIFYRFRRPDPAHRRGSNLLGRRFRDGFCSSGPGNDPPDDRLHPGHPGFRIYRIHPLRPIPARSHPPRGVQLRAHGELPVQHRRDLHHPPGSLFHLRFSLHPLRFFLELLRRGDYLYGTGQVRGRMGPGRTGKDLRSSPVPSSAPSPGPPWPTSWWTDG